jgi:DNA-binding NarL/FixJ family response regulator
MKRGRAERTGIAYLVDVTARWVRRVLVVEDQAAMRLLVCETLNQHGFETRGAGSAAEATREFAEFDPDVLLADIDLGSRPSGAELAAGLVAIAPHLGVVFLSSYPRAAAGATAMGVAGAVFVSKLALASTAELVDAVETVMSTQPPAGLVTADREDSLSRLTRHQLETLSMVAHGWSNDEIAARSQSSVRAVERSISRIFERLGLTGDPALSPRVAAAAMYVAAFGPAR